LAGGLTRPMLDDGELVDDEPVVVVGGLPVDEPGLVVNGVAVVAGILHGDAVDQQMMEAAVVFGEVLGFGAEDLAEGGGDRVAGQVGVDAGEGGSQAIF
jgi:hypothetical protein